MTQAAFVTGGLRRLGAAIARTLAVAGYDLVLQTRDPATIPEDFVTGLEALGRRVEIVPLDLDDVFQTEVRLDSLFARRRDIALVVNNASRFEPDDFASLTSASFEAHMRVNTLAPLLIMQRFAAEVGRGAVVNILDAKLDWPNPDFLSYTLAKAALEMVTDLGARYYAPAIRVNGVAPGLTLISPYQDESRFAAERRKIPLGTELSPEDIADAVLYLARAASVTGEVIRVDGGERYLARVCDPSA